MTHILDEQTIRPAWWEGEKGPTNKTRFSGIHKNLQKLPAFERFNSDEKRNIIWPFRIGF